MTDSDRHEIPKKVLETFDPVFPRHLKSLVGFLDQELHCQMTSYCLSPSVFGLSSIFGMKMHREKMLSAPAPVRSLLIHVGVANVSVVQRLDGFR